MSDWKSLLFISYIFTTDFLHLLNNTVVLECHLTLLKLTTIIVAAVLAFKLQC